MLPLFQSSSHPSLSSTQKQNPRNPNSEQNQKNIEAMESSIGSRKRKQRPSESDPFSGIFTRSRSQIYFHRHRSGYARPDSNRSRNIIKSLAKQQQLEASVEVSVDPVTNQVSVKDLRARRVFSPATDASNDVVSIGEVDLEPDCKKDDVNPRVLVSEADLGVFEPVVVDLKDNNVTEGEDVVVQMTPEENKSAEVKNEMSSAVNEVADIKGVMNMNKSQQLVTSLRGRRKVFKSPTSFNYRRLLPYLMDSGSDDSSSFEIIEATLPKSLKSSNPVSNTVVLKDEDIVPLSNSSKLADGLMNNAKSGEQQLSNGANAGLVSTVESSDVVQKTQEDVANDTLKCEQMTPPSDSITYNKSKADDVSSGVLVKPTSTRALKSCSRQKLLQTPTSFSHRRLLPFLMSVAEDYSCPLNDNKSLNLENAIKQNQQPPTQPLHKNEKLTTTDEASNSPTSTLTPVDISTDITKPVTLVSNDNISDANTPNKARSGSVSQLEVNLQVDAVKTDSCIKTEQSPPKVNLKLVEEPTFNPAPLCIRATSEAAPLCVEPTSNAAPSCIEATSKAAPLCIEQSDREDHLKIVKESPTSNTSPLCIEQSYGKVKESPQQYLLQVPETQGEIIRSGILKRNPRGCRGICNCLNCTSFRLHAERSFEFSKNQMHDAEEVALELINDLSYLRNILETTSTLDADKEKLVKDACAKALYKEQEARARLAQMNEDLSFHCRSMNLLRPKVTFANKIEEKFISKNQNYGKKSV
ncbi:hypothetical protein HanXRQr2_Chr02g0085391 [Helianthus annuus]|uniref:Uncharacterized protein n=2 Tax=Helianthus annuus TaxID=4232 RepID=A0A9K3JQY7_HELAN|nr:uncharacterized protein LOC110927274 [Helianthus annuus]KAF5820136.1 hypothetical protein HanXRQr2_Chr02g0085391 [Helianthus annuus]KAJ0620212.1 hypothetical protein HanHA89_Chr02g0079791 [Helianthus annuus]KAJ0778664.1 hypothetical protein HanLR1_Chr02g0074121 [Helianthus annuus]KAJ0953323.1 hypothetical protein HanPSC8_Chr02g0082511 [Helianthus annuus]